MRAALFALLTLLSSCAHCPRPQVGLGAPRVEDKGRGIPRAIFEDSRGLLDEKQVRLCQMVFEPSFTSRHAVWMVQASPGSDADVVVRVRGETGIDTFSAPLDAGTASRLSRLCLATLTTQFESCQRFGIDGTWFHAAHPAPAGGYAMASFWTPRPGTLAEAFVGLASALRDYAALPVALRPQAWLHLLEAERALSKLLPPTDS